MYIKQIVIEGFKSYGARVEICDFDPYFNAITGLNGTGKSNILDAICFLMGITQLGNMRVSNLLELVFKQGNGGISRASVSITFDNRDSRHKPVGLESFDEFVITRQCNVGGRTRYLLNGAVVLNRRITDLFCGVQLNVNNPHFLIMQGRITKVLNMKANEILSLVEEAAGTKMYETKKINAQKIIERKDVKLRELEKIIVEEISPRLQKLQDEQAQYQEYQQVSRELDNLQRLLVAYRFVNAEQTMQQAQGELNAIHESMSGAQHTMAANNEAMLQLDEQINNINAQVDADGGARVSVLQTAVSEAEKREADAKAEVRALRESIREVENKLRHLANSKDDDQKTLEDKRSILTRAEGDLEKLREPHKAAAEALERAQASVAAVGSGRDADGGEGSLQTRLIDAEAERDELFTRIEQRKIELRGIEEALRASGEDRLAGEEERVAQEERRVDAVEQEVRVLEETRGSLQEPDMARMRMLGEQLQNCRAKRDSLAQWLAKRKFEYSDPVANFDRTRVLGLVWRLVTVPDERYSVALSAAAGGKLANVVVDTSATGKLLLESSRIAHRVSLIPLDKVTPSRLDYDKVRLAQKMYGGPEHVSAALDMVTFPEHLRPAMAYVFGNVVICSDYKIAAKLAYDPKFRLCCVTMDGQMYEPSGVATGGSNASLGELTVMKDVRALDSEMATLQQAVDEMKANNARYVEITNKHETACRRLASMRAALARTDVADKMAQIRQLRETRNTYNAEIERDTRALSAARARADEARLRAGDVKGHRDRELKRAEKQLADARKAVDKLQEQWERAERRLETLRLEAGELERGAAGAAEQYEALRSSVGEQRARLEELLRVEQEAEEVLRRAQGEAEEHRRHIAARDSDAARFVRQKDALAKQNADLELKGQSDTIRLRQIEARFKKEEEKMESLVRGNAWIEIERRQFGVPGGPFDFAAADGLPERVARLADRKERLSRGLNQRAHTLLGKEAEQFQDLKRKKDIVERDRAKLYEVMAELDRKMSQTIRNACSIVAKDFGSVFASLLPGACARLVPILGDERGGGGEDRPVVGLEMNVGFNGVWRTGLSELSGGQRSLVALSLVLALLRFKPAPIYILDEVDAALDLNHTQHIGEMLRKHFRQSQFLIVSLKEGMFNNANVLFRTQLVNGMSRVQRYEGARATQ